MRSFEWIKQHVLGLVRDYSNIWLKVKYDSQSRVYSVHVLPVGVLDEDSRLRGDINRVIGEFVEMFDDSDLWFGNEGEWEHNGDSDFEAKGLFFDCPTITIPAINWLELLPNNFLMNLSEQAHEIMHARFRLEDISVKFGDLEGGSFSPDPAQEQNEQPESDKVSSNSKFARAA